MTQTPTLEQQAILDLAKSPESLIVKALAGAAKTTTLTMLAARLPMEPTACVAFNKSIATEMGKRMPGWIACSTMNSIGHRAWAQRTGKRLKLEADKMYSILMENGNKLRPEQRKERGEAFASILKAARLAKSAGYIPESMRSLGKSLHTLDQFLDSIAAQLDVNPDDAFAEALDQVLEQSITEAYNVRIDFDDQIYMSCLFGGVFTKFHTVMVDEAQDLSVLNRMMLEKMVGKRLIAVGDENQAIYGFRGADYTSMERLKEHFGMRELTLSTSFRCPRSVVQRAQAFVPHMTYPDWAEEGEVRRLHEWDASIIEDGAAIICRNNAPLFAVAMYLLRNGRSIKLRGNDIGSALLKQMRKIGPDQCTSQEFQAAIDRWENEELQKARESRRVAISDRAECMRVFAESASDKLGAIGYAEHLFAQSGKIELMTGHKAKGEEWDHVYHLDSFLIPSKFALRAEEAGDGGPLQQERNLRYVIETRSKKTLSFIASEDMQ